MPCATERIRVVWNTRAYTGETECGNGFEEDGVDVEAWGWDREGVALYDADEEEADENPPCVRGELPLQMGLQGSAGYFLMDFSMGMVPTPIYECSDPIFPSDFSGFCTPSERSSYTLVERIEMMTGSADMYMAAVYTTSKAGAISLMLMMDKPVLRIPRAWNNPDMTRFPGGMLEIVG